MELVRSGPCPHIDYGTVAAPVFAGEISRLNLDLLNGLDTGNNAWLSFIERVCVDRPIEDVVISTKAVTIDGNRG